ncbi:MAG: Rab family GTPase [Candidatus Hermodarchaeota archaeon]
MKYAILVTGDPKVGKKSFVDRFTMDIFRSSGTRGFRMNISVKIFEWQGELCPLVIFEIPKSLLDVLNHPDHLETFTRSHIMKAKAKGCILLFDLTSKSSIYSLSEWIEFLMKLKEPMPVILVGTKNDLTTEREISPKEGQTLARYYNMPYIETSALTRDNIDETFIHLLFMMKWPFKALAHHPINMLQPGSLSFLSNHYCPFCGTQGLIRGKKTQVQQVQFCCPKCLNWISQI